jgi:hypothetical protein
MGCVALSFNPDDRSFNLANALYLAHASDVAYIRAPGPAAEERLGLKAHAFRNNFTRTRGFLGICDTHAVLAFRGTDPVTLPNWVTDTVVRLVRCGEYEGKVHSGFSSVLRKTWSKVETILEEVGDRPLYLTGHSMGGALAVLTAYRLAKAGKKPMAVYTYGSPRIGDPMFCSDYTLPTYRIVNRLDLVPELPLASLKRLLPQKPRLTNAKILKKLKQMAAKVPCYSHVKTFVYIDRDGTISIDPDIEPWHTDAVARVIATRGKSFLEGITDHMITNYICGLEGQASKLQTGLRRRVAGESSADRDRSP